MEALNVIITVIVGLLVRFGIPIALTVILVYLLRRLDERWQAEAKRELLALPLARNIGCWDVKNCSPEQRQKCSAYSHPDSPCWQHFRDQQGALQERCLGCDVFRQAPVPLPV
jgi:hypothetical protein